jgi:hypothetical protein
MAGHKEQLQKFFKMYEQETGDSSVTITAHDVAAWAIRKGLWEPRKVDFVNQLADELAKAWREEYRTDKYGRRYRAKHARKERSDGRNLTLWADIDDDSAPRSHFEGAFAQRRQQIVGDCLQLKTDVDVYNDRNKHVEPIQIILDFTQDVEELQLLNLMPPDEAA